MSRTSRQECPTSHQRTQQVRRFQRNGSFRFFRCRCRCPCLCLPQYLFLSSCSDIYKHRIEFRSAMTSIAAIDDFDFHDARVRGIHVVHRMLVITFSHCVAYSPRDDGEHSSVWFCSGRLRCRGLGRLAVRDWTLASEDYVYSGKFEGDNGEVLEIWRALETWFSVKRLVLSGYGGELVAEIESAQMKLSKCRLTNEVI
jgi:hypothetical protein